MAAAASAGDTNLPPQPLVPLLNLSPPGISDCLHRGEDPASCEPCTFVIGTM